MNFLKQYYDMVGKKFDNLIISRTFSKGMGAAGVRLAYIVAQKNN